MRYLLLLLMCSLSISVVAAQETEEDYTSSDGLFSVPLPTNWTVTETENYAVMADPENLIRVYLLSVESDDPTQAIDDNLRAILPDFDLALDSADITEVPSGPGIERTVLVTYDLTQSEDMIYQGFAYLVDGRVYMMIFDADIAAATRRQSQISIIASGFTVNALERTDLSTIEPLTIDDSIIAELEDFITYTLEASEIPGAAVAIVQDGEVVYAEGFGVRESGADAPVTPETLMMIGSTTKTFTTLYLAQLVDEGILTWDTPVVDILPSFALADPEISETITVRNLVCACIGVPRRDMELIFNTDDLSAADIMASLAEYQLFTDFGEAFQYSNQLVAAGGYIGSLAAGGDLDNIYNVYVDDIHDRILEPVGMNSTLFDFEALQGFADVGTPHGVNLDFDFTPITLDTEQFVTPIAPAGALWSNVEDMSQYLIMLMQAGIAPDGTRIVSEENLLETWQPQVNISAQISYGLGWMVEEYKGLQVLRHGGNTFGFTSDLAFLPSANIGIVVLTNARATNFFNEGVSTRLFELLYEQEAATLDNFEFMLEQGEASIAESNFSADLDLGFFADFTGMYSSPELGGLEVRIEGDTVVLDIGEFASELRASLDEDGNLDDYVFYEGPLSSLPILFETDDTGTPQIIIDMVTDRYVFTPVN